MDTLGKPACLPPKGGPEREKEVSERHRHDAAAAAEYRFAKVLGVPAVADEHGGGSFGEIALRIAAE
jgi:hypothetical protein